MADFFKSEPMYITLSIITILGFVFTVNVYIKIKSINYSIKKLKKLEYYKNEYEKFMKMTNYKNVPTDLYQRVERTNRLLYFNIGFIKSIKIKRQFKSVDPNDKQYVGLKAFFNDIIITLERDIA